MHNSSTAINRYLKDLPLSPHTEHTHPVVSGSQATFLSAAVPCSNSHSSKPGSHASHGASHPVSCALSLISANYINESNTNNIDINSPDTDEIKSNGQKITLGNSAVDNLTQKFMYRTLVKCGGFVTWTLTKPEYCHQSEGLIPMIFRQV